jgi:uncharacterized sulfatase
MRRIVARMIVGLLILAPLPPARGADGAPKPKTNVLFIMADDYCTALGCYGRELVKTPNLDRLAGTSTRFERAYCQVPLCNPSRASLMTGMRPQTTRVLTNGPRFRKFHPDVVTLPQLFKDNGYFAGRVGKIYHLGIPDGVGTAGFDDEKSWTYAYNPPGKEWGADGDEFWPAPKFPQQFRRVLLNTDGAEQHDAQAAARAVELMAAHKDEPFFLAVGFIRPHVPEIAPKTIFDGYPLEGVKLPAVPEDDWKDIPPAAFYRPGVNWDMSERDCRESKRAYYAAVTFMDAQVGRVLDALDRLKLADRTLVVFVSDHGYHLGEHFTWQKMTLFEESCRVPMMIREPGQTDGRVAPKLVELIDLYPTVAAACGLKAPATAEGTDLGPVLRDPGKAVKAAAFTQLQKKEAIGKSVRTERWRYTEWGDNGAKGVELYDHETDPGEFKNLAEDPAQRETLANLRSQLRKALPAAAGAE